MHRFLTKDQVTWPCAALRTATGTNPPRSANLKHVVAERHPCLRSQLTPPRIPIPYIAMKRSVRTTIDLSNIAILVTYDQMVVIHGANPPSANLNHVGTELHSRW